MPPSDAASSRFSTKATASVFGSFHPGRPVPAKDQLMNKAIEAVRQRLRHDRPMETISMRLPADVIDELKRLAPTLGFSGYQPLIQAYIGRGCVRMRQSWPRHRWPRAWPRACGVRAYPTKSSPKRSRRSERDARRETRNAKRGRRSMRRCRQGHASMCIDERPPASHRGERPAGRRGRPSVPRFLKPMCRRFGQPSRWCACSPRWLLPCRAARLSRPDRPPRRQSRRCPI